MKILNQILKNAIALIAMLALAIPFTSCDKGSDVPVIKLEQNPVEVTSSAGDYAVEYTISNPVAGGRLDADTECEWIEELAANGWDSDLRSHLQSHLYNK